VKAGKYTSQERGAWALSEAKLYLEPKNLYVTFLKYKFMELENNLVVPKE
jgi:hypothetical protein